MNHRDTTDSRDRLLAITLHLREVQANNGVNSATRDKILATAMTMFTRRGYAGTSMRDIAKEVGIKAASIYAHCPEGKEQMLHLALQATFDQFLEYITREIRFEMTPLEQLRSLFRRHVQWQLEVGERAMAWDAAINQFGVLGVLSDEALSSVRRTQALYHAYHLSLVQDVAVTGSPEDSAIALRVLCDQAPEWAAGDTRAGAPDDRPIRLSELAARILGIPEF